MTPEAPQTNFVIRYSRVASRKTWTRLVRWRSDCLTVMMWFAVTRCSSGTNLSFRKRAMGQSSVFATSKAAILSCAYNMIRQKV